MFKKLLATGVLGFAAASSYGQTTPVSGDIAFLSVDADTDGFTIITLKRLDLSGLSFTDNGVLASGTAFRTGEGTGTFPVSFTDVPAGTIVRYTVAAAAVSDSDPSDGTLAFSAAPANLAFNASGDQVILFTGAFATPTFVAGVNWANANWTAGATDASTSLAPATAYAVSLGSNDAYSYTASVTGDAAAILASATTPGSYTGTDTGTGPISTANIRLNKPVTATGTPTLTVTGPSSLDINFSGVSFLGTTADTRWIVVLRQGTAPDAPADGGNFVAANANFTLAPAVITTAPSTTGNGAVVFSGYKGAGTVSVSGLTNLSSYVASVHAVNGNGVTSNFSAGVTGSATVPVSLSDFSAE